MIVAIANLIGIVAILAHAHLNYQNHQNGYKKV
jgi:hypothetical protein